MWELLNHKMATHLNQSMLQLYIKVYLKLNSDSYIMTITVYYWQRDLSLLNLIIHSTETVIRLCWIITWPKALHHTNTEREVPRWDIAAHEIGRFKAITAVFEIITGGETENMFGGSAILHQDLPTYRGWAPEGKRPSDLLEKLQPAVSTLIVQETVPCARNSWLSQRQ